MTEPSPIVAAKAALDPQNFALANRIRRLPRSADTIT